MAGHTYDAEFVEFIVQEVIRRLKADGLAMAGTGPREGTTHPGAELVLEDRLVTLATLHGRLQGVRTVVVKRRTLVTPAVRDELKHRNIDLRQQ